MTKQRPTVGIPVDVKQYGGDVLHAVGEKYINAVAHGAGATPYLLPALAAGAEIASLEDVIPPAAMLDGLDGLFLTGSPSNMAPRFYASDAPGVGPFDIQRDRTTLALIRAALDRDMPILAVCRGFQELNVACGGTLYTAVHEQPGFSDHRDDSDKPRATRYGLAHDVYLVEGGWFAALAGAPTIRVNSLHGQGIAELGEPLRVEGRAPDGLIEAARRPDQRFTVGVQWHPEWRFGENEVSRALFAAFGEALCAAMS